MAENSMYYGEDELPDEEIVRKRERKPKAIKKECNSRIDELSKPKRWLLLGTWRDFGRLFEPKRMQSVKERVQELFSMSPEETELYFNSLRSKKPRRIDLHVLRRKLRKERLKARREAYHIFQRLLEKAMRYAYKKAPPLLVTPMLRVISDHILEMLCGLHQVSVPKRSDNDAFARFLVGVADWTAIFVANIYYEIEVEERNDVARLAQIAKVPSITSSEERDQTPPTPAVTADSDLESEAAVTDYDEIPKFVGDEEEEDENLNMVEGGEENAEGL